MYDINAALNRIKDKQRRYEEEQYNIDHQKIINDDCKHINQDEADLNRTTIVGKLFLKHFPIVQRLKYEDSTQINDEELDVLERFIMALATVQRNYQDIEDKVTY